MAEEGYYTPRREMSDSQMMGGAMRESAPENVRGTPTPRFWCEWLVKA